jgi:predicted esterase
MTLEELRDRVYALYAEGRFDQALHVLEAERDALGGHEATGTFWATCLLSVAGRPDEAVATLQAGLDRGLWWSGSLLNWESDLDAVRGRADFRKLAGESDRRMRAGRTTTPVLVVHRPERPTGALLIALHGASSTAEAFAPHWEAAARFGVTVAVPEPAFPSTSDADGFSWSEPGVGDEVEAILARIRADHAIDPDRIVLAGYSQGGRLAVEMALRAEPFPVRGVISVAAGLRSRAKPPMPDLPASAPRFWFLTGEGDFSREAIEACHDALLARGVASSLEVVPGLGHELPGDFAERLPAALDWVLRQP